MIQFTLNCTPTPQARARHAVRGKHAVAYKSADQQANEATLDALLSAHVPENPLSGAVELLFTASFPVPRSTPKNARKAMLRGEIGHTKKPDLDNLAKQLKDAMTRLQFWQDDKQVVKLTCAKVYAEQGSWTVLVKSANEQEES